MNVVPAHVAQAAQQAWRASPALAQLVPGGLWFNRAAPEAPAPYATLMVEPDRLERTSGTRYLAAFRVEIQAWSDDGAADSAAIGQALADELAVGRWLIPRCRVLKAKWVPGKCELDPETRNAADVVVTGAAYELLVEADNRPGA